MGVPRLLRIAILVLGTVMFGAIGFMALGGEVYGILVAGLFSGSANVVVSPSPDSVFSNDQTVILIEKKESLKQLKVTL